MIIGAVAIVAVPLVILGTALGFIEPTCCRKALVVELIKAHALTSLLTLTPNQDGH
jgi:hypothetical protein